MNTKKDVLSKNVEYVKRSKYRPKVIKSLHESPKIPSEIAEDIGINKKRISQIIKHLREPDLIVCINPEYLRGRVYKLTESGEEIVDKI